MSDVVWCYCVVMLCGDVVCDGVSCVVMLCIVCDGVSCVEGSGKVK